MTTTYTWIDSGTGLWSDAANWSQGSVPNAPNIAVTIDQGAAVVDPFASYSVGTLDIGASGAVDISAGASLLVETKLYDAGLISLIGAYGPAALWLGAGQTVTFGGGGVIDLGAKADGSILGAATLVDVDVTIEGSGYLDVGATIDNRAKATIDADVAGEQLTVAVSALGMTNEGLMEASGGGVLALVDAGGGAIVQSGGGTISAAAGSTVELVGGQTLIGGALNDSAGGVIETALGQTATLGNVRITVGSVFTGSDGSTTYLFGAITGYGTLALDSTGDKTEFQVATGQTAELAGKATLELEGTTGNDAIGGGGALVNVDDRIIGAGDIGDGALSIDNQAGGAIISSIAGESMKLTLDSAGLTNEGLIEARTDAGMDISGASGGSLVQSASGTLAAWAGSTVEVDAALSGGIVSVGYGADVEFADAVSAAGVSFTGTGGAIRVDDPSAFASPILGAQHGIDIIVSGVDTTAATASIVGQNLIVQDAGATVASFELVGDVSDLACVVDDGAVADIAILPVPATVAQYERYQTQYDTLAGGFGIDDNLANIVAALTKLDHDRHITSLTAVSGQATLSGASIAAPSVTISGAGTALTIAGPFSYGGALDLGAGAAISVDATDQATFSGTTTLAGALEGAGAVVFAGGTSTFDFGATANVAAMTESGAGTVLTIDESLSYGGALDLGAGAAISVDATDQATFSGTTTLAGALEGAGAVVFGGGTSTFQTGATANVAAMTESGAGTSLIFDEIFSYGGSFSQGQGSTLLATSLTLSGAATLEGQTDGEYLTIAGQTEIASGASIQVQNWGVFGVGASATLDENLTYSGALTLGAGAEIAVDAGDALTRGGTTDIYGALGGAGEVDFAGAAYFFAGATASVATLAETGAYALLSVDDNLAFAGTLSQGAGSILGIASGDQLTLTGSSTPAGTVAGPGTLVIEGAESVAGSATISIANWKVSGKYFFASKIFSNLLGLVQSFLPLETNCT
ncbi:MAG: beta strand repeat-containing protein [Roseiarcus sp.]